MCETTQVSNGENFYIGGKIYADTLGEICRALGESYIVYGSANNGITFQRTQS